MSIVILKYNPDEIFEKIERSSSKGIRNSEQNEIRKNIFKEELLVRIKLIIDQCKYYYFENSYTEHTWKELHALHYANTTYADGNKVHRIHFWNSELNYGESQLDYAKGYLGFITLRPIPDYSFMLSQIIPNWKYLKYFEDGWIMSYPRKIHIGGEEILIDTTPFYSQDTVYIRCAHADILMFNRFLHHAYKFPKITVSDMIETEKYHPIPNDGLDAYDMLDIFHKHKVPVNFYPLNHKKSSALSADSPKDRIKEEAQRYVDGYAVLDTYLESGLPVIIYNNQHVVLVIGHTNGKGGAKKYIVYDDSGYFLHQAISNKNFIGSVSASDLFPVNENANDNKNTTYMIAATYERVYLNAPEYFTFLEKRINQYRTLEQDMPVKYNCYRNLMVDNTFVKKFLKKNILEGSAEMQASLDDLLKSDMPHYMWYSECKILDEDPNKNYRLVFIADPTYPSGTSENIFWETAFCCKMEGNGISLLTQIKGKQ